MYTFSFSACFYLIGQNQIDFDEISEEEIEEYGIPYDTFGHSFWFTYFNFIMNGRNHSSFKLGLGTQSTNLYILWVIAMIYI